MSIKINNVSPNKPTRSTSGGNAVKGQNPFSSRVETSTAAKPTLSKDSPISHEDLSALARDFKNGLIDKEEANSRFVSAVVDKSVPGKLSEKDREVMTKDIAEFFSDDPEFMNKLQKNLRDLA